MRAAYASSFDTDEPLAALVVGERPAPTPPPGWTTVRVVAASLNHHDLWTLRGVGITEDRLPLIEERTLVVYGDKDSFVGREWAERVAMLLPRGRLRIVSGEPHAVHYTRPELVAGIVCELLVEELEDPASGRVFGW